MTILPEFLQPIVNINLALLQLWFSNQLYEYLLKRNPKNDLVRLHGLYNFSALDDACVSYYHGDGPGAKPTFQVGQLLRALVVKYLFNLSYRETEMEIETNLLKRWFVGLGLFESVPDHATLQRFESWMQQHQVRLMFDETLTQIDMTIPCEKQEVQIGDTFAVRADAAKEDQVRLLRHGSEILLRSLKKSSPEHYEMVMSGWDSSKLFGEVGERIDYYLDEEERRLRLESTVLGVLELQKRVSSSGAENMPDVQAYQALLEKILADEINLMRDVDGKVERVEQLAKEKRGTYRLGSSTDPEASFRKHGKDVCLGYNAGVAASPNGIIREIRAAPGAEPDQAGVAPLIEEQKTHLHSCPAKFMFDQAAGSGKTRFEVDEVSQGQTQLVAKVHSTANPERFGPTDFTLSADDSSLTCPNGVTTTRRSYTAKSHSHGYRFSITQCKDCPLSSVCRNPKSKPNADRVVFISDYLEWTILARAYNQTPEFKTDMKLRPRIERIIAMLTRYDGARRARFRGLKKVDFQLKMCAMARNLRTWLKLLEKRAAMPE